MFRNVIINPRKRRKHKVGDPLGQKVHDLLWMRVAKENLTGIEKRLKTIEELFLSLHPQQALNLYARLTTGDLAPDFGYRLSEGSQNRLLRILGKIAVFGIIDASNQFLTTKLGSLPLIGDGVKTANGEEVITTKDRSQAWISEVDRGTNNDGTQNRFNGVNLETTSIANPSPLGPYRARHTPEKNVVKGTTDQVRILPVFSIYSNQLILLGEIIQRIRSAIPSNFNTNHKVNIEEMLNYAQKIVESETKRLVVNNKQKKARSTNLNKIKRFWQIKLNQVYAVCSLAQVYIWCNTLFIELSKIIRGAWFRFFERDKDAYLITLQTYINTAQQYFKSIRSGKAPNDFAGRVRHFVSFVLRDIQKFLLFQEDLNKVRFAVGVVSLAVGMPDLIRLSGILTNSLRSFLSKAISNGVQSIKINITPMLAPAGAAALGGGGGGGAIIVAGAQTKVLTVADAIVLVNSGALSAIGSLELTLAMSSMSNFPDLPEGTQEIRDTPDMARTIVQRPSEILEASLEAAAKPRPSDAHQAHHIVARTDKRAATARSILEEAGIGLDEAINGIWLPETSHSAVVEGLIRHANIHTTRYYNALTQRLQAAAGSASRIRATLEDIAQLIAEGKFPH